MGIDDYNSLSDMLKDFYQELNEINNQLQNNKRSIKEADVYTKSFFVSEPEDFKYFSPRNVENIHKEELERIHSEKAEFVQKCQDLEEKKKILSKRIALLENILDEENYDLAILDIHEEDRQRIARDLHDTSLQNLAHLVHKIELSSLYIDKDPIQAKLELSVVNKILKETIEEIRNIIFNLRPMTFDDLGLKAAFERLIESTLNQSQKYKVVVDIEDVSCETNIVLMTIYRIIQECLNNIEKHAEAENIYFSCKVREGIGIFDIKDDGKGFDVENYVSDNHFGISLIRERIKLLNGKFDIKSKPDEGTEIHIEIPVEIYKVK